jgi:hypothetical protein
MASATEICNLALSHLGISKPIANVDTEQSQEAATCRVFYTICRDVVLRDYRWPFATEMAALNLIEADPNEEWAYSYRYPTDCLLFRRILSGQRNDTHTSRTPYRIGKDSAGKLIFSDMSEAWGEYTVKVTDTQFFPPDFTLAMSYRLASYIAARLTAGDPFKLSEKALNMYRIEASRAVASAFNEEQPDQIPDCELIEIRK